MTKKFATGGRIEGSSADSDLILARLNAGCQVVIPPEVMRRYNTEVLRRLNESDAADAQFYAAAHGYYEGLDSEFLTSESEPAPSAPENEARWDEGSEI